ncbi:hypothetical protein VPH35_061664 [Triticum aestivum]
MEVARSVVFDRISYPPLILAFCSLVHRYGPLHIYPCICSVAPCLRVLWMSTHGCFSPFFPLSLLPGCRNQMPEPRSQTPPSTTTPTTPEVPTVTCRPLTTTKSSVGGSQAGGPAPLSICIPVCASLLKANLFNLCLYSDIVASTESSMIEHLYSSPRGPCLVL